MLYWDASNSECKRNLKTPGREGGRKWGLVWGFASKLMPHIWSILHMELDKSPPLPHMPQVGHTIDRCIIQR